MSGSWLYGLLTAAAALALAIAIAALLLAIFQTVGAVRDHLALAHQRAAQQPIVEQGIKLRARLQAIAGQTAELANAGDIGAATCWPICTARVSPSPPDTAGKVIGAACGICMRGFDRIRTRHDGRFAHRSLPACTRSTDAYPLTCTTRLSTDPANKLPARS